MDEIKTQAESTRIAAGECPFCGKIYTLPLYIDAETYAEANEWAAQKCDCEDARRKRLLDKADERLKTLFEGFDDDLKALLNVAVNYVWEDTVEAVTVRVDCYTDAKISKNSKGLLIITKKRKVERQEAIG